MFDLNQFIFHQFQTPTNVTSSENIAAYYIDDGSPIPSQKGRQEYLFDGTTYHSLFRPNSDETKAHLSYIEGFILSKNKQHYFVRRDENESFLITFTYEGEGYLEYDSQKIILRKGDGFFIDCRQPHFYKTNGKNWLHFDLHINGYFVQKVFERLKEHRQYGFSQPLEGNFQRQLENLVETYNTVQPCRELLISNQLDSLLTLLLTESENYQKEILNFPENLRYLIRYINSNYMKDLSLDYLSAFSGISKSHLIRLFHTYLHCPPKEYIIQIRLDNAKQLLISTTLPANKIGIMVGIENENYFRHLFKNRFGLTPKEYRKSVETS